MRILKSLFLLAAAALPALSARAAGQAEHVVLIVWDGLRPDSVTPQDTPTLYRLAQEGTFFAQHHPVYPSTTEVNGTALATGMYPAHSGLMGNREFRPGLNPKEPSATEDLKNIRKGDQLTGGKYLRVPTIYETLQNAGYPTVVAGTKGVALIPDRSPERDQGAAAQSCNVFAGRTLPAALRAQVIKQYGKFPPKATFPDAAQNKWTVDVLLGTLWKKSIPKLTLLWLSDPDYSQHDSQPGSPTARASLRVNDKLLARVLANLETRGIRDKTDILLVSDHGFSTIGQSINFKDLLRSGGFQATWKFKQAPKKGDILVAGNGGSVFFYVIGHDQETTARLVRFLQQQKAAGVIFAKAPLAGTFPLSAAHIDSEHAPDVVVAVPWNAKPNQWGTRGMITADAGVKPKTGLGMHGSLSPYDMHNTLIANGPDFRSRHVSRFPSGNVDVAPTILWILGVSPKQKMDGRVLSEAMLTSSLPNPRAATKTLRAKSKETAWKQSLQVVTVGETEYLNQGSRGQ